MDITTPLQPQLEFQDWGLVPYQEALTRQLELVEKVALTGHPGFLIFCTHPPVVTLGRATQSGDVFAWSGETIEISRGGRATYHGPSQLVIYPILNLNQQRQDRKEKEIAGYLRSLENCLVEVLKLYGVEASGRSLQKKSMDSHSADETGVWVGSQKIASLGIGVKKWITYHGAAINLDYDPLAFQGMNPCGFQSSAMVSLEQILNQKIDRVQFQKNLFELLLARL
jgi:lipoate-protein ligase B